MASSSGVPAIAVSDNQPFGGLLPRLHRAQPALTSLAAGRAHDAVETASGNGMASVQKGDDAINRGKRDRKQARAGALRDKLSRLPSPSSQSSARQPGKIIVDGRQEETIWQIEWVTNAARRRIYREARPVPMAISFVRVVPNLTYIAPFAAIRSDSSGRFPMICASLGMWC